MNSVAASFAHLSEAKREAVLATISDEQAAALLFDWRFWARPNQLEPAGDWDGWLILAGRGFGKTRTGAEWVRDNVCGSTPHSGGKYGRIALVAETAADARDVMVEGESGLLATHPKDQRPIYEPSKRRVTWANGAVATLYNATEPDQLRGPQHDLAWLDELAKWRYAQETFDMLQFGLRLGDKPRQCVTTTPRPTPLIRYLMKQERWVVTRGSTYDNKANLAPSFVKQIISRYEGTRLGRQELNAEVLDDAPGALWTRAKLDETRRKKTDRLPDMQRVVVAIDPAASAGNEEGQAETGIVVAGIGTDGRGYVLDDVSCRQTPNGWARQAVAAYDLYAADAIVAETNQGGEMVEQTIRSVRPGVPYIGVRASRGKVTRAEPVAALYEQGRVSHVGAFPALEDQMVLFTPLGIEGGTTADRTDALVWAMTELFPSIVNRVEQPVDWEQSFRSSGPGAWLAG